MLRDGMLMQLHFSIDAIGVEDRIRRAGMCASQGFGVRGLEELEKRARQPCLFERPEPAIRLRVIVALASQAFVKSVAIVRRDERSLNRERARHRQSTASGKVSRAFLT